MTRPSLAGVEQRAEAATEGPWEAFGTTVGAMTGPVDCGGCSGLPSPRHEPVCLWRDLAEASEPDAAFIADARTAVPALTAAVRDVLALHQPCDNDVARTPICQTCRGRAGVWECGCWADEDRQPVCSSCTDSDPLGRVTPSAYPCPTVRALATHLDLTDPEGDPT